MKTARNTGKEYIDRKNKLHLQKSVKPFIHNCRYKCNDNFNEIKRNDIFMDFWALGSWELQTSYLNGVIKLVPVKRRKQGVVYSKNVSCEYRLLNERVCKEFFLKTLDLSNKRIQNLVNKKKLILSGVSPREKRGKRPPGNKISQEIIDNIKHHINQFPKYVSHYSRHKNLECKYLDPGLTVRKMYKLYQEFCAEKGVQPEKESYYRHIFNTQFNLRFHRPLTDTCGVCDKLQNIIDHGEDDEARRCAATEKEVHLRRAEAVKTAKNSFRDLQDETHVAVCFDLQKMLPTPALHTSKAYYLRQLWTYNFCIHNIKSGVGYMFVWHEGQASRGCQEIASCLLKFIQSLPEHVTQITAFSDNCGGQNKSKIIVKFWLYIIAKTQIKTVHHRFLISGHSFNECDKNFGLIEIKRKKTEREFFVPEQWKEMIAKTSSKFMVIRMTDQDFVNLDTLQTFYKDTVPGIRAMQWLRFEKDHPYTLFFKNTVGNDSAFETYSMKSTRRGKPQVLKNLPCETKKPLLKQAKYSNLMELLQFVPPIHHDFYRNLPHQDRQGQQNTDQDTPNDVVENPDEADTIFESDYD